MKIRRVLDVLRNYVEHWPYLRSTSDQFPLDQSWRGRQQTYRVQVNNKTLEIKFHDNATIGNDHKSQQNQYLMITLPLRNRFSITESLRNIFFTILS